MYHHGSTKLDTSSFLLHSIKPSISHSPLKTATPSSEDLKTEEPNDIFAVKTQGEISNNYNKILLTYGKWNAEEYLKILNELTRTGEAKAVPLLDICPSPELRRLDGRKPNQTTVSFKANQSVPSKQQKIIEGDCKIHETHGQSGRPVHGLFHVPEDLTRKEPTYKKIFHNAKLNRTPREDESLGKMLTVPSSKRIEKTKFIEEPSDEKSAVPREPCKLMKDGPNNYLLDLRKSRLEKNRKKVSYGSASELYIDDVERYYQNKPIKTVLENSLEDQIQLMRARLKSHVSDVSGIDLLRETGYDDLKARCLNDFTSINEFQDLFNDSRWRKKFDLVRIEDSDDANTLDVSDIASSETASVCSGDSLGTELDYKPKPVFPSRIPCIAEVREMGNILFDKISAKWERTIQKNFLDAKMKPRFTHFCHAMRLRSTAPVYSDIMKLLEPYDDLYSKKFIPHKYRMIDKLEKMEGMQKAKEALVRQRRALEPSQIGRGWARKSPSPERNIAMQEPKKYRGQNQRRRLAGIMRETKHRAKEGSTDWTKQSLAKDYVNLKPVIQTKTLRANRHAVTGDEVKSARPVAPLSRKIIPMMQSLWNVETSLFLDNNRKSLPPSSSSKNKLATGSKSKLRMPI